MTNIKSQPRNVVVLGATGSIGCSTLDVVAGCADQLRVVGLSGHTNVELLQQQAEQCQCSHVVVTDADRAELFDRCVLADGVAFGVGPAAIESLVSREEVDVVVTGIVGSAGLRGTWAALQAGKTVFETHSTNYLYQNRQRCTLISRSHPLERGVKRSIKCPSEWQFCGVVPMASVSLMGSPKTW